MLQSNQHAQNKRMVLTIFSNFNDRYRYFNYHIKKKSYYFQIIIKQLKKCQLTPIIGLILFIIGICLLVQNEHKAVKIAFSLQEALNNIVIIKNISKPTSEFEGCLVHLSGSLKVSEPLTELDYGVIISSVKLKRRTQMYQWIEFEDQRYSKSIRDKNYYYTTEWKDKLVDSNNFYIKFGHNNPKKIFIKSRIQISNEVKIGNVLLGMELKKKFNDFVEITSDERPEHQDIKMHSGLYYHSSDLWNPKVGDIRVHVSYSGKVGDIYTVIGKLVNGILEPYKTTLGEEILLQRKHIASVDQMFHFKHVNNYWKTWIMRVLSWLIIFVATTCLSNNFKNIITNSKFLCKIINIEHFTMGISISMSFLVIAFTWMWYKPVIGLGLILILIFSLLYSTIGFILASFKLKQQQRHNAKSL